MARRPAAVLLDRDGTLVRNVHYNGDPGLVEPIPGVAEALGRLRAEGIALAVVSNQSGIARGLITAEQVERVNARIDELLGPFGAWLVCPHGPDEGCDCRKPLPGLVEQAARALGAAPAACVMIGDLPKDVEAGLAAGARAILVPSPDTPPGAADSAPATAPDLGAAVTMLLEP